MRSLIQDRCVAAWKKEVFSIGSFKKLLIPLGVIVSIVVFFLSYNTYLVDHSLEDLKFVLNETARAQTIGETGKVGAIMDDLLINEISSFNINSLDVTNLEFTKNIMNRGGANQQLEDAEFLLRKIVKEKEKKRGGLLIAFDRMSADLRKVMDFITKEFLKGAFRPEIFKDQQKIDISILQKAKKYETDWKLKEAISAYEEFMNRYPLYPKIRTVTLRLIECYTKSGNYREAERLCGKLIQEAPQSDEASVAGVLLAKAKDRVKKQSERNKISGLISKLVNTGVPSADYEELKIADEHLKKLDKETEDLVVYIMEGKKAVEEASAGIDLSPLEKAKELESKWQLNQAELIYQDFIFKNPDYSRISYIKLLLANVYLKSKQYEKALSNYENVAKDSPGSEDAALAEKLIKKTKEIIEVKAKRQSLIDKIAKLKMPQELAEAYYKLGVVDLYLFDLENAQKSFQKVKELAPGTPLAKKAEFNLGWVYKFSARYDESIEVFSKISREHPEDKLAVDSAYQVADSYYKSGRFTEAAEAYGRLSENFSDSQLAPLAQFQAGYTYLYDLHDPIKAGQAFKTLSTRFPGTDIADYATRSTIAITERSYKEYGFILLKQGKFLEAEDAFKKAISIDKEDAQAHSGLGTTYSVIEMLKEGLSYSSEGLAMVSDEYTHAALAFAYQREGNIAKAIEEYRISISKNPGYAVSRYNLGKLYVVAGLYDAAIFEFKETVRLIPDFAEAHNDLGTAYWYRGQTREAEFEFKQALTFAPDSTEANYNLGLVCEIEGKYSKAAAYFEKALSAAPNFLAAKRHLERVNKRLKK